MRTAFVTGVQGFTGRYLVPTLRDRGYAVHGLIRPDEAQGAHDLARCYSGDVKDLRQLRAVISEARADVVVHLAGIASVRHDDPSEIYEANLVGTRNLLQALVDSGAQPSAVLLASSANVYGNQRGGALAEDARPQPVNEYGISKIAMEWVAKLFMDRLPIIIARPFNYTGRGQSTDFLIPKIVSHVRRAAQEIELGNLDVERDFSDVRAVVDAYARLLETKLAIGGTFNICSGRAVSLRKVIDLVRSISGRDLRVRVNPALIRSNEVMRLWGSSAKLEQAIGPISMPLLEETLRWMIED